MLVVEPILTFTGNTVTWNSLDAMSEKSSSHPEVAGTQYPKMQHHIPEEWTCQTLVEIIHLICIKSSTLLYNTISHQHVNLGSWFTQNA
jgi:hypothetical protein